MAITASTISTTQTLEEFRLEFNKLQSDVSTLESNPTYGTSLIFEGATADAYETTLAVTDPTADRTITLPNATGTVLLSTQATFEPSGDTSAGDNAAIGYTSAEGLVLTGQGSTSDITLKNDADGTVFTVPTGTDDILFPDNAKAMFGAGSDLQLYHDASHSYIVDNGTGNLKIQGTQVDILGSGETMATFVDDGAVTLYYDNTAALATASGGGTLTGTWEVTTALVPDASDGAALGTTALEWSDLYLADGAVIYFGDDQDVTLTHAADTSLTLNLMMAATTFEPSGDTAADDNAAIGYTSAEGLILTGQGSTSDITFKNDADTTVFTIPTGTDDILFPDNAKAMWGDGSDFVIYHNSSDSSTYLEESGSGSIYIKASNFYIQDASGTEHIRTVDDSYVMLFHNGSEKLATSSAGGTLTGTWETTTALVPDASDGAALGTTSLEWSDLYLADGAVIGFGDNQDVTLTHVHDTGLLLNGAMQLQFSDASQYINAPSATVLDINATDEIELNATLVDINANVEISGTATTTGVHTFTAVPVLPANSIDSDHYVDGSIDNAHIADDAIDSEHYAADSIDEEHIANDAVGSAELKTLSTLLIKDSSGSTLKTLYGAGA